MKLLSLLITLAIVACAHHAAPPMNFATTAVMVQDGGARCLPFYRDTGAHHAHSAMCMLSDKTLVYYVVRDDAGPALQRLGGDPPAKPAPAPPPRTPEPPAPSTIEPPPPPVTKTPGKRPPAMK